MLVQVTTPSTSGGLPLPTLTTTYYFGKTDGKDTLSFGSFTAGADGLVIAVDAAYGATSGIQFSGDLDARQVLPVPSPSTTLNLVLLQELCSSTTSLVLARLQVLA